MPLADLEKPHCLQHEVAFCTFLIMFFLKWIVKTQGVILRKDKTLISVEIYMTYLFSLCCLHNYFTWRFFLNIVLLLLRSVLIILFVNLIFLSPMKRCILVQSVPLQSQYFQSTARGQCCLCISRIKVQWWCKCHTRDSAGTSRWHS